MLDRIRNNIYNSIVPFRKGMDGDCLSGKDYMILGHGFGHKMELDSIEILSKAAHRFPGLKNPGARNQAVLGAQASRLGGLGGSAIKHFPNISQGSHKPSVICKKPNMESCPSGRRCSTRNAVSRKASRVRIPNSPPVESLDTQFA